MEALEWFGWTVNHVRAAQTQKGRWVTPTTAVGWPDLLGLREDAPLLVIENKRVGEYPDPHQRLWLELFHCRPGALVWVSRPSDPWDDLLRWLRHPDEAPTVWGWEPAGVEDARARVVKAKPRPRGRR